MSIVAKRRVKDCDIKSILCGLIIFFFNDTATTEIYTLSLHDALPIYGARARGQPAVVVQQHHALAALGQVEDRKSTRLNSSHLVISYAVFCLKKKKIIARQTWNGGHPPTSRGSMYTANRPFARIRMRR